LVYFFGDGNHQTQFRLDHFLLGDARLALADLQIQLPGSPVMASMDFVL
jgi:hypothetical protein